MLCPKCGETIPVENVSFCCFCGAKLTPDTEKKRRGRVRANGTGSASRRGSGWECRVVIGWRAGPDGKHKVPVYRSKGGFTTKRDALNYCSVLLSTVDKKKTHRYTLQGLYDEWEPFYSPRVGKSTLAGYKAAYGHFKPLHNAFIDLITKDDLQKCVDDCTNGKRTKQMMRVTAGLLWGYALDKQIVQRNVAENLYTGKGASVQREPLTDKEVETIKDAIGKEQYADYIYCLCYLGFRPGEFLALRKTDYIEIDGIGFLVGGSKTDAGRDRRVIIPPQIVDYVKARLNVPDTDLIFPMYQYKRGTNEFIGYKPMTDAYFRESVFKPMMARLGIAAGKVPYAARHTYSDKLKRAEGDAKSKAALMGHSNYDFTQSRYQSTDVDDMLAVAVSME